MVPKSCKTSMRALSCCFFIILRESGLENISVSDMLTLRVAWYHIHCQWQVSSSGLWEFVDPGLNSISFKTKNIFEYFCSISGNCNKFWTFWEKRWSSYLLFFGNYRLSKTWLDHSLKNTVSEHPLKVNMLICPKIL